MRALPAPQHNEDIPTLPTRSERTRFPGKAIPEHLRKPWIPNIGGRPPIFAFPEDMEIAVAQYFSSCWTEKMIVSIDIEGNKDIRYEPFQVVPYTMAGLAQAIGMSTSTLRAYGTTDKFSAIVLNARSVIEGFCEKQLHEGKNASTIWQLMQCNFGYRMPKQESAVELTGKDGEPLNPVTSNERARATRAAMLEQLHAISPNTQEDTE